MPLRTGVDLTSVERIEFVLERHGPRFLRRFFPEVEEDSLGAETCAGLWAVKEAAFKVIGAGSRWSGVRVDHEPSGRPYLEVDYERARLSETTIPLEAEWDCSISHDGGMAVATAACLW